MNLTFDQWWDELVAMVKAKKGTEPGTPWLWQKDNYDRGQTPEEAYKAEYEDWS